jgi:dephospho-CoA kinase
MASTLKIGITGGIGVGKSTACLIFKQLGIPIYEADMRAKWLISHHPTLISEIKSNFGEEAYLNGELNRRYLAEKVFIDKDNIQKMNNLVHPKVGEDSKQWFAEQKGKYPYLIKEAALLYESGSYQELDKIIVVTAPLDLRIERIQARDPQRSKEEILGIMNKQMPEDEKVKKADFIIYNDEKQMLIPQVLTIHQKLINITKSNHTTTFRN